MKSVTTKKGEFSLHQIQNTRRTSAALSRSASANSKQTASVSYSFLTLPFWFKTLSFAETPFYSSYRPTKTVMPGRRYPISRKTPCLSAWFKDFGIAITIRPLQDTSTLLIYVQRVPVRCIDITPYIVQISCACDHDTPFFSPTVTPRGLLLQPRNTIFEIMVSPI